MSALWTLAEMQKAMDARDFLAGTPLAAGTLIT